MKVKDYLFPLLTFCLVILSLVLIAKVKPKNQIEIPVADTQPQQTIKKPDVAGSFYPADKDQLDNQLTKLLSGANQLSAAGKLRILIVPHAGVDYAGQVAAWGFKQLEGKSYSKVIILGPSHKATFSYVSVFPEGSWETPLGLVAVDEDLATRLIDKNNGIQDNISVFSGEHSLEIELIFLQKVLKNFKVVPMLIGQVNDAILLNLADKISKNIDDDTLLVVSSDLSHYPTWDTANAIDNQTIKAILSGNADTFKQTVLDIESRSYLQVETAACGQDAIWVALKVAQKLNLTDFKEIKYENSGDVTSDKSKVVGYGAIGVWDSEVNSNSNELDDTAKKEAINIAINTLYGFINNHEKPDIVIKSEVLKKPLGAFVTLNKNGQLRGCVGKFEPTESLANVIQDMAVSAATQDSRFQPVTPDELKDITVEISVLTPTKRINNWRDIILGKNGVVVQKDFHSGTFLPQVATENNWTLEEFLSELCSEKAGLPNDCYKDPSVAIYTFEAQVFEQ